MIFKTYKPRNFQYTSTDEQHLSSRWIVQIYEDSVDKTSSIGVGFHCKVVDLSEIYNFAVETYP